MCIACAPGYQCSNTEVPEACKTGRFCELPSFLSSLSLSLSLSVTHIREIVRVM